MAFSIQNVRLDGCLFGLPDRRDFRTEFPFRTVPDRVDLRPFCTSVEHQGEIRSCTINATVGALEYLYMRRDGNVIDLSRMFVYFNARRLKGDTATDSGAHIREAMGAVTAYGVCREDIWPYDPQLFARAPASEAYDDALKHETIQYSRIAGGRGSIAALAEGLPVVFAIKLPDRCYVDAGKSGVIPHPTVEERIRWKKDAGHSMLIVGYDNIERVFIVRNSWGQDWGDRGYCKIAYDTMEACCPTDYFWIIGELEKQEQVGRIKVTRPGKLVVTPTTGLSPVSKMRANIRSHLDAELETTTRRFQKILSKEGIPPKKVLPRAEPMKVIPGVEGRPELALPDNAPVADLKLPPLLKAGLRVSYSAGDSSGKRPGVGYLQVNINFATPALMTMDARTYYLGDVQNDLATTTGCSGVVGNAVSAGLFWIHPTLLTLLSQGGGVRQAPDVKITRMKYEVGKLRFDAVSITSDDAAGKDQTIYDIGTGLLIFCSTTKAGNLNQPHSYATFLSKRELNIPWANKPTPSWVAKTQQLDFRGNYTLEIGDMPLPPLALSSSYTLQSLADGVVQTTMTSESNMGHGLPVQKSTSETVCASAMFYPLWIAPETFKDLKQGQTLDEDPITKFMMTFGGLVGQHATILEKGPLEETTWLYDVNTGMFSGYRGQKAYGQGTGTFVRTELSLQVARQLQIFRRVAGPQKVIPEVEGRPELVLPDNASIADLKLPAFLRVGLHVSYSAGDARGRHAGIGYCHANFNFVTPSLITMDVRIYSITDVVRDQAQSLTNYAVDEGNVVSVGLFWIHPTLLDLISKDGAPVQPSGAKIRREKYETDDDDTAFDAVWITRNSGNLHEETIYDANTGLLLSRSRTQADLKEYATFLARRQLNIPWADRAVPSWVGKTKKLKYEGSSYVLMGFQTLIPQTIVLLFKLKSVAAGVVRAKIATQIDVGMGIPPQVTTSEMVCAPGMFYSLWIAPETFKDLKADQLLDEDPVTKFKLTFSGVDGKYATIFEQGPLEETTYFYDLNTGMFSGFKGQKPYGEGMGAVMFTEVWLTGQE